MKTFLEKNQKPVINGDDKKKNESNDSSAPAAKRVKVEKNGNKAQKVIDYFIENQSKNEMPDFKMKSKHKRLFKKCLKLKKSCVESKIFDKSGKFPFRLKLKRHSFYVCLRC